MPMLYRVEDNLGEGMYHSSNAPSLGMHNEIRHPSPREDSKLYDGIKILLKKRGDIAFNFSLFKYGFSSLGQLKSWIYKKEWKKGLHKAGFSLSIYKCEEENFVAGDTQAVVLLNTHIELIERKSLLEI